MEQHSQYSLLFSSYCLPVREFSFDPDLFISMREKLDVY